METQCPHNIRLIDCRECRELFPEFPQYVWTAILSPICRDLVGRFYMCLENTKDAEDLAQNTLEGFFRGIDRFDPSRPLRPWIFGIGNRLLKKHFRDVVYGNKELLLADNLDRFFGEVPTPYVFFDLELVRQKARLSEYQYIIGLQTLFFYAPREIAKLWGDDPRRVRREAHRAREKIRTYMSVDDFIRCSGS